MSQDTRYALRAGALVAAALLLTPPGANATKQGTEEKRASAESGATAAADAVPEIKDVYVIQIRDHRFHPERLLVPAGRKIKLRVENLDETPEEFESYDFNREKTVEGGGKITVYVGPLKPGEYTYFGEFHPETAQGVLVARPVPDDQKKQ
jgi:plastocyanin